MGGEGIFLEDFLICSATQGRKIHTRIRCRFIDSQIFQLILELIGNQLINQLISASATQRIIVNLCSRWVAGTFLYFFSMHNYSPIENTSELDERDQIMRILYKNCYQTIHYTPSCVLLLAHSMSLCNREASVVRLSVRLSVNFAQIATSTTEVAGSLPNLHTMVPRRARIQGVFKVKVKVKVKGHVIRALL